MDKIKVLAFGDGYTPTGFARVNHNIFGRLHDTDKYDIHHVAVNFNGDPHTYKWNMYPARLGGDLYGFGRIKEFAKQDFDLIYILNDPWGIRKYIEVLKKEFGDKLPPIVTYFPVDSENLDKRWFEDWDAVAKTVVYTQFGFDEYKKATGKDDAIIIPHGTDTKLFFRFEDKYKQKIREVKLGDNPNLVNGFIVLNANRNQPRKHIDLTIEGFAKFAKDKPDNVWLYLHMGLKDMGIDIVKLVTDIGIDNRIILSNNNRGVQQVSDEDLTGIYNMCNVGINTSMGEGWGLVSTEHANTGAYQIVPNHSACKEIFSGIGELIDVPVRIRRENCMVSYVPTIDTVAESLENVYDLYINHPEKFYGTVDKAVEKFSSKELSWDYIAEQWDDLFTEVVNGSNKLA